MNKETSPKIVVLHEGLIESWLKDIITFGMLFFMLYANHRWLGDHVIVAVLFVLMIVIAVAAKGTKNREDFYDKESAKKCIDDLRIQ